MANLDGILQQLREKLEQEQSDLHRLDAAISALEDVAELPSSTAQGRRRTLSPAARRRIADAQRRRWAGVRAKTAAKPTRARRSLSPAARRRIVAAQKARWARFRAERKKAA
jgi:hypothetical protein